MPTVSYALIIMMTVVNRMERRFKARGIIRYARRHEAGKSKSYDKKSPHISVPRPGRLRIKPKITPSEKVIGQGTH